jgi:hypothetical protein
MFLWNVTFLPARGPTRHGFDSSGRMPSEALSDLTAAGRR